MICDHCGSKTHGTGNSGCSKYCTLCKTPGHRQKSGSCPFRECSKCKAVGHSARECRPLTIMVCAHCGSEKHPTNHTNCSNYCVDRNTRAFYVVPVRKFLESPIDAKFVRVYGAGVLGKLRIDCMSCAYREQNVEPIDFHFRAMLILAVSLPRMTEKAAKCALRRRTIALVMAGCLAFCANVVWAFVTAAGLVAKIVARRTYRDVGMLIIVIFLVITCDV